MDTSIFALLAMALDTLPYSGRVMMLAALLAAALCLLGRRLDATPGSTVNVLFRKGALLALLIVPFVVYGIGIQMPVYVDEFVYFDTPVPALVASILGAVWLAGALLGLTLLLRRTIASRRAASAGLALDEKLDRRVSHWRARLSYQGRVHFHSGGSTVAWQAMGHVLVPSAVLNWPVGLADVVILQQLAQAQHRAWGWVLFGRMVQALYWPIPWIRGLVDDLAAHIVVPSARLAASAYRDPEGWGRDVRNLDKRGSTLDALPVLREDHLLRLPEADLTTTIKPPRSAIGSEEAAQQVCEGSFSSKWRATKARRASRHRDPYEQAYWLIAAACIVVGIATTLTIVQAPPEFEPQFLQLRWQDQMGRRPERYEIQDPRESHPRGGEPPREAGNAGGR
ncbi:MAG: hypothetical protein AAF513_02560 [Pseudomonadota bacterium]